MFRYVSKLVESRVRDTFNLGVNVRKSFNVTQQQQQQTHENDPKLTYSVVPRHQDPSRDKDKSDEQFKRKYSRLHKNHCFLNALTWSTALITGFYASQLLCLYRRNQRLAHDGSRCYYSKYLVNKTASLHKNVKHLLTPEGQQSFFSLRPIFSCPFKKAKASTEVEPVLKKQRRTIEDEFKDFKNFVDPEFQKYASFDRFFDARTRYPGTFNVSNDGKSQEKPCEVIPVRKDLSEEEAIDEAIQQLANIVGEFEFQLGIESVLAGHFNEAVDHFKLSTNRNHPGGIFNLGICYEQGMGVKKNLKTARKLYEIASRLGHAKALYNLGVFSAQGLGGASKDSHQAKMYFEKAAELGNHEAELALKIFLPRPKKLPKIEEFTEDEFFFNKKAVSNAVSAIAMNQNQMMRRVAVS